MRATCTAVHVCARDLRALGRHMSACGTHVAGGVSCTRLFVACMSEYERFYMRLVPGAIETSKNAGKRVALPPHQNLGSCGGHCHQ